MSKQHLSKGTVRVIQSILGKSANNMVDVINLWINESGTEWTCNRLKAIRTGIYQLKAGNVTTAIEIWQHHSISYDHNTFFPKGIFGYIGKMYTEACRHQVIRKYDTLLRVYTSLKLNHLSDAQYRKAESAITADFSGDLVTTQQICQLVHREMKLYSGFKHRTPGAPDLSLLKRFSATHKEGTFGRDITSMPWGKHVASIWTSTYLPSELCDINRAEDLRQELVNSGANNIVAGHIAFLQEGGAKARVIAVPNAWIQVSLKPLEDVLDNFIRTLPESCSHEQVHGAYFLQRNLSKGTFCFDLSSATDRFPLVVQKTVLKAMGYENYAEAIDKIAHAPWKSRDFSGQPVMWTYNVGQPMGMYCSFKLFHLTHIMMLRAIARFHGVTSDSFRVLGDDVIISDPLIAETYQSWMNSLGVELSSSKSIISDKFGEFAGFVGVRTPRNVYIHRPCKLSGHRGMGSALNLIYSIGKDVQSISPFYAKAYEVFRYTIGDRNPDLSPVVSTEHEAILGSTMDSHYLGSLSNRISYSLPYDVSDKVISIYELQQVRLLGEKETVNVDGFSSRGDNLLHSFAREFDIPVKDNFVSQFYDAISLMDDPLYKAQRLRVESL